VSRPYRQNQLRDAKGERVPTIGAAARVASRSGAPPARRVRSMAPRSWQDRPYPMPRAPPGRPSLA